jgi:hypothetical protein
VPYQQQAASVVCVERQTGLPREPGSLAPGIPPLFACAIRSTPPAPPSAPLPRSTRFSREPILRTFPSSSRRSSSWSSTSRPPRTSASRSPGPSSRERIRSSSKQPGLCPNCAQLRRIPDHSSTLQRTRPSGASCSTSNSYAHLHDLGNGTENPVLLSQP